jgi:hypothetical protein
MGLASIASAEAPLHFQQPKCCTSQKLKNSRPLETPERPSGQLSDSYLTAVSTHAELGHR